MIYNLPYLNLFINHKNIEVLYKDILLRMNKHFVVN